MPLNPKMIYRNRVITGLQLLCWSFLFLATLSCTSSTGEHHWVLAEELYVKKKYAESIKQFKKVAEIDPKSLIGQMAYLRSAEIYEVYLNQPKKAANHYRQFIRRSTDQKLTVHAQKKVADIYFSQLNAYEKAIEAYDRLLRVRPSLEQRDYFLYKIGKSKYHLLEFEESSQVYQRLIKEYPSSSHVDAARYEIGNNYYMDGQYQESITAYKKVIEKTPNSKFSVMAKFGIASCYEELEELEKAYILYKEIKDIYPNPKVVVTKMDQVLKRRISKKR